MVRDQWFAINGLKPFIPLIAYPWIPWNTMDAHARIIRCHSYLIINFFPRSFKNFVPNLLCGSKSLIKKYGKSFSISIVTLALAEAIPKAKHPTESVSPLM